ncbi:uncharacterized protein F4822DRAFT_419580 [Hypoxylon trugodes]|uniref:uncharacterized protein n=1 Tax=Hypoxylon trugodes TaxID=326681 RepID=UPI0021997640|nr:uncharacterized protein F4822DRAFT_419580 [Hypoxylon trugodes]KAI1383188.1 hypothetical protein F4822DRAFT_419580 [Hypoxylon trugodes]
MPGLTLNTEGTTTASGSAATPIYPPQSAANQHAPTPVPVPTLPTNISNSAAASSNTNKRPSPSRDSSPQRPPYSPITPPLNPLAIPPRPNYTHSTQKDQQAIPPPPPEPIDFDTNPDILALKSAISILQMQRRKAQADMAALSRAKNAALAEPEAFVRDLTSGRIAVEGDRLFVSGDGEDSSSEDDDEDEVMEGTERSAAGQQAPPSTANGEQSQQQAHPNISTNPNTISDSAGPSLTIKTDPDATNLEQLQPPSQPPQPQAQQPQEPRPWTRLPKPQNIVRCPPINWSQYAVVGDSLDKLHAEQLARPSQGTPAVLGADGRYEFKAGAGKQEKLVGIAAPYNPGKDRIDNRKSKVLKR